MLYKNLMTTPIFHASEMEAVLRSALNSAEKNEENCVSAGDVMNHILTFVEDHVIYSVQQAVSEEECRPYSYNG